ncbi:putative glycosyl transferase [Winogradskyella sp. PG-2]|nr:putative glycosyl transferase [Winogradskyella sp. PG-2]
MILEMGLTNSIDELYNIRQESTRHLIETLEKNSVEISYDALKADISKRMINADIIPVEEKNVFINLFEAIDVKAEASVQYINQSVLDTLKYFKSNGGKVYLVSDFYGSKSLFEKLLKHHGILDVFEGIYSSAALEKSKHSGTIYAPILEELAVDPKDVMMIGDNQRSDYTNAIKNGLNAYQLPHKKYLRKNKRNNFGNDNKDLKRVMNSVYKTCRKRSSIPYTEYVIFYHVFAERVYEKAKRNKLKDLFFLSREGKFLKKLFDSYQDFAQIDESRRIKTHYLKISRHAALQMSLKAIEIEPFSFLQLKYKNLSTDDFLIAVNCPDDLRAQIISELHIDGQSVIEGFFKSETFENLKQNETLRNYWETHRKASNLAFRTYIKSFNVDIEKDGITVIDIGWGGTMQEAIYNFYDCEIPVTGYYLGLGNIYNIQPETKRYGLISSIMPYVDYNDHILMANQQLYEQFSGADHGSALDYSLETEDYVLETRNEEEKWLYDNYIKLHQEEMLASHKVLLQKLESQCYSQDMMQNIISKIALKVGLFQGSKKLKFLDTLSNGFFQNVGNNQVGISYEPPKIDSPIKELIKFLMTPEKYFRYLVKVRPVLYKKSKLITLLVPMYLIYCYIRFNKYIRFNILERFFLLKHNAFNKLK